MHNEKNAATEAAPARLGGGGGRRRLPVHSIVFIVIFSMAAALFAGALVSMLFNNSIFAAKYTVDAWENTAADGSALRIALISDLHRKKFDAENQKLVDTVAAQSPDIICVDGDMLEPNCTEDEVEEFASLLGRFREIAPVYCAYGNHDEYAYDRVLDDKYAGTGRMTVREFLERTGAVFLEEEYVDVDLNGRALRIGGMFGYAFSSKYDTEYEWDERFAFLNDFCDTDRYKILMCHRPDSFILNPASLVWDVDLVLSGHTHNGVLALPLIGAIYCPNQGLFPKYAKGKFELGSITLVVNAGLDGSGSIPRVFNPPEITVIDLK